MMVIKPRGRGRKRNLRTANDHCPLPSPRTALRERPRYLAANDSSTRLGQTTCGEVGSLGDEPQRKFTSCW